MERGLLLWCMLLVHTWAGASQTAKITGQIFNKRESEVRLNMYADLITYEHMQYAAPVLHNNTFEIEVVLRECGTATIVHATGALEVFLEPGDSLHITFDAWDPLNTALFSGVGAAHNTYLAEANQRFRPFSDDFLIYKMIKMNPDAFKAYLDVVRQKKLAFYHFTEKGTKFSETFKEYALADINYWWAHLLMRFPWEHAFYNKITAPMQLPESYYSFFNDIQLINDEAITNLRYIYFIDQYLVHQNLIERKKSEVQGIPYDPPPYRGALKYLSGKPMYYVLANELYMNCKEKKTYFIANDVKRFLEECPIDLYKEIVATEFRKNNGLAAGEAAPEFTLVDIDGKEISLSDFRGKVVYLDFWATWCLPCTYEIINSKELKSQFEGKDVVFMYISLDANIQSWRTFINKHELKGVHLFAKGLYKSEVAESYSVRGLPSFFLIDKDGKLARVPAKRASESGVVSEIYEVLAR